MKFEEVVENMDVNYHPDDGEMYYPVKVVEKGYYKGDPFVLINCPNVGTSDWGLVPVDPDNLSRIPGIRAHCWNCKEYVQLDSSYMNTHVIDVGVYFARNVTTVIVGRNGIGIIISK
ncbi:hypothetical protein [Bacillus luti]